MMSVSGSSASTIVAVLEAARSDAELEKVRRRLAPGEEAFGLRMRDLFDIAEANTDLPIPEVHRLLDHPAWSAATSPDVRPRHCTSWRRHPNR